MNFFLWLKIILLTFSSNYYTRGLYRLHAGMLNGGTLAIYFPVTATRLFPFEVELYYIQHILILVVAVFLLTSHGDVIFLREKSICSSCVSISRRLQSRTCWIVSLDHVRHCDISLVPSFSIATCFPSTKDCKSFH